MVSNSGKISEDVFKDMTQRNVLLFWQLEFSHFFCILYSKNKATLVRYFKLHLLYELSTDFYSSNKIRKAQNEDLNMACQNLNAPQLTF